MLNRSVLIFLLIWAAPAFADENSATVAELHRAGKHYRALVSYDDSEDRGRLSDTLAAAGSAWALNLPARAEALWEEVLRNPAFQGDQRTRTNLSLAILHYQEGRLEEARALAERTLQKLPASDLRTQFLLLIGETLMKQRAYSLAQRYYERAVEESPADLRSETFYLLGECQRSLGLIDAARKSFVNVEVRSKYGRKALRSLLRMDYQQGKWDGVKLWHAQGLEHYPDEFQGAEERYMLIASLLQLQESDNATDALRDFEVQYSPEDPWVILAHAAFEAAQFKPTVSEGN